VTRVATGSHLGRPRAKTHGGPISAPDTQSPHGVWVGEATRCVTPRQTCPQPNGFGRNLRSKTRWFTGFCNSHQVSHFATFFIDARAEISVAESRYDIGETSVPPPHTANGAMGDRRFCEFSLAHAAPGFVSPHCARLGARCARVGRGQRVSPETRGPDMV
jgi:hypothetical protein